MLEDGNPASSYRPSAMRTPTVNTAHQPETVTAPQPESGTGRTYASPDASGWGSDVQRGWGDDCASCLPSCCGCCNNHFYAYIGGLAMGRDMPNKLWTTFDQANPANQLRYFPGADWGGGIDTRIGYWFGCGGCGDPCNSCNSCGSSGRFGIEAVYWGAWGLDGHTSIYDPTNQLGTVQDVGLVSFGANAISNWFDNARSVELSRNDEVHNVEINFMYLPCCDPCNRFQLTALAGIRFLRFDEGLRWGTLAGTAPSGARFGDNLADEAFVNADVQNNLVGFQIGACMNWQVCNSVSLFAMPKIGIFGNHINGHNSVIAGDGTVATFDGSGNPLNIRNTANVFSMLGSIDVGVNWAFARSWSFVGGYRVVVASNIALGDNQIPQFFADEAGWHTVKTNGDLLLHGAFAGIEYRF
jgi:hypothetical protein